MEKIWNSNRTITKVNVTIEAKSPSGIDVLSN